MQGKRPASGLWLVLASDQFGVLTWPMQRVEPVSAKLWRPSTADNAQARWQHVFSFDTSDWCVCPLEVWSPAHCKVQGFSGVAGIWCFADQGSMGILEALVVVHTGVCLHTVFYDTSEAPIRFLPGFVNMCGFPSVRGGGIARLQLARASKAWRWRA